MKEPGALLAEIKSYPPAAAKGRDRSISSIQDEAAIPLKLRTHNGVLSFLRAVTTFGTAVDITLSELSMGAFYPTDDATLKAMSSLPTGPRLP